MVAPVPVPVVAGLNPRKAYPELCESFKPLLSAYSWDLNIAYALMKTESGCNPARDNSGLNSDGTNDVGLMQINSIHIGPLITDAQRIDPKENIRAAWAIYQGSIKRTGNGWNAWSAYNNGMYLKNL